MFGYIKPCKPEMKVKEFDTFKAVYCGLCKQLSHTYGPFASLTLSYDFTFLATVSLGLSESCAGFKKCACTVNPLSRKQCLLPCDDLTYSASTAMLMMYHKVKDDIADSKLLGKLKGYLLLPFASHARKKAAKRYPDTDQAVSAAIRRQAETERSASASIDRAADPTASALAYLFEGLSEDAVQKKVLHRFGYLLGRYVYFADALDDLEDDRKSGGYNPFLKKAEAESKAPNEIRSYAQGVLNMTVGEIAPAYELLELKRYKSILDNIIYLGLHNQIEEILRKANPTCKEQNVNAEKEQLNEQPL